MNGSLAITNFQINGQERTALTDSAELSFSVWVEGAAQTVRLRLFRGEQLCWDSGDAPWEPQVCFSGLPLTPKTRYEAVAEVSGGEASAQARMELRTGLMGRKWDAGWVEPVQENAVRERDIQFFEQFVPMPDHLGGHDRLRPVQELRREFTLDELPKQAVLYASARGVYSLRLNGKRVDARRLAPETTPYESLLYYQIYDLTHLLRRGENTLCVLLGDGWWIGRIGLTGHSCQYGDRLAFLGQLELEYADGTTKSILTDGQYQSRESFIRYSDLFMGEKWDLSREDAPWKRCIPIGAPSENLTVQPIAPILPWKVLEPLELLTTPNGELVADFGQCLAGVAELRLNCPAGTVVTLDHSEVPDGQGNFFRNILGRNKDQQDTVVCGAGESFFCPEFTYHGFRYLRITGAAREQIVSVRAVVLGTQLRELGSFCCSDPRLNQLQHNIRWSTRGNMVSVPTDCPQREKAGWTGDILAFAPTGCFNYDLSGFLSAWLGQMRLSQTEDGGIPVVIPSYPEQTKMQAETFGNNTSAAWSDACVLIPLELYRAYGDKKVLRDNLDMMEKWMGFIERASRDYLWTEGFHFGDWLIPSYQDDPMGGAAATRKVIASCQYAVTARAFLDVLEALEAPREKIDRCRLLLENIRRAIRENLIGEDGSIPGDFQGMYVMALYSGAAQGELAVKAADRLARLIEQNGECLDTGFVSGPHLLDMLAEHGHEDLAWRLLLRTKSPGWLYQVEQGATAIWENWNAICPDGTVTASSFNHYAFGCVGDWIYRHIGGLRPMGAGWSQIEFAPDLDCALDWAECKRLTPYGTASCGWAKTDAGVRVEVVVPCGVKAELSLSGKRIALTAGSHVFFDKKRDV